MNSEKVKEGLRKFSEVVSFNYPSVSWYYSSEEMDNSFIYKKERWVCMFMYLKMMMKKEKRIRFSNDIGNACTGPLEYFGFSELVDDGGIFLAETERFCKTTEIAQEYTNESATHIHTPKGRFLYMELTENIEKDKDVEVITVFPEGFPNLTKLVTLSGYDSTTRIMDNVLLPNAAGCQSLFTIPYNEKFKENPGSTIGLMEPMVRNFIPDDMVAFSLPSNRFIEMANNIEGSFLDKNFKNPKRVSLNLMML